MLSVKFEENLFLQGGK